MFLLCVYLSHRTDRQRNEERKSFSADDSAMPASTSSSAATVAATTIVPRTDRDGRADRKRKIAPSAVAVAKVSVT